MFIGFILTVSGIFIGVILSAFINYDIKICISLGTVLFWGIFIIHHGTEIVLE